MQLLTIITMALLIAIALVHFYWAFGGTIGISVAIPTKNGKALFQPKKWATFGVGIVMLGFAWIAYSLCFSVASFLWVHVFGWVISVIFIVRAIGDFHVVGFFKKVQDTMFARYDTTYYSPLTLFLGVVFSLLSYSA